MEFDSWRSYWAFSKAVRSGRTNIWPTEVDRFLQVVRHTAGKRALVIRRAQPFFRAQLGWEHEVVESGDGTFAGPEAHGRDRMKPDPSHASDGRASAAGVAVLYLAMDTDTAIAEVRPWIGSAVSVSQFRTNRDLRALDLSASYGTHWLASLTRRCDGIYAPPVDLEGKEKAVWADIDNAFSRPVNRGDDPVAYVPTQILAKLFQDEGYEAIVYHSSVHPEGCNVMIFDPSSADPVSGQPYQVKRVGVDAVAVGNAWVIRP